MLNKKFMALASLVAASVVSVAFAQQEATGVEIADSTMAQPAPESSESNESVDQSASTPATEDVTVAEQTTEAAEVMMPEQQRQSESEDILKNEPSEPATQASDEAIEAVADSETTGIDTEVSLAEQDEDEDLEKFLNELQQDFDQQDQAEEAS